MIERGNVRVIGFWMRQWGSLPSLLMDVWQYQMRIWMNGFRMTIPNKTLLPQYSIPIYQNRRSIDNELSLGKLFDIIGKVRESVSE